MAVYVSKNLKLVLQQLRLDPKQLIKQFEWWKADPERINESMFFGRDALYAEPQIQGRGMVLRHAHMLPIKDHSAHERWLKVYRRRGEKTSDKALIYAENSDGDYLLIYIFDELGAHARARQDMQLMRALARLAIKFIDGDLTDCELAA